MSEPIYIYHQPGLRYALARLLGVTEVNRNSARRTIYVRARSYEFTLRWKYLSAFETGIELLDFGRDPEDGSRWSMRIAAPGISLFVKMPRWFLPNRVRRVRQECDIETWGLMLQSLDAEFPSDLVLRWGHDRSRYIGLPWRLDHYLTRRLLQSGAWYDEYERDRLGVHKRRHARRNRLRALAGLPALPDPRADETWHEKWELEQNLAYYKEEHGYTYVLRSGEAQDRTATIQVREMEWRRRWLRWTRLGRLYRRSIEVQFSGEVGERTGSWKGGTVGCSYEMLPNELPVHALRRMEAERKFN